VRIFKKSVQITDHVLDRHRGPKESEAEVEGGHRAKSIQSDKEKTEALHLVIHTLSPKTNSYTRGGPHIEMRREKPDRTEARSINLCF